MDSTNSLTPSPSRSMDRALPGPSALAQSPALAYLARLQSEGSRRTQNASLQVLARIALNQPEGPVDPLAVPWHQLTYPHVSALRAVLAKRYAPATANRHLATLRGVVRESWRLGLLGAEEMRRLLDVEPVRGHREPKGRMLDLPEIEALFAAAEAEDDPKEAARYGALLALALSGLRLAEIATIGVDSVKLDEGRLVVRGKGNKERSVPVPDGVSAHLARWLRLRGDKRGAVLQGFDRYGKLRKTGLSTSGVRLLLGELIEKAGLSRSASPHDFRRTYISRLLDTGTDLLTVQKMAGHAKPETTAKYDKRGERAKQEAAALVDVPAPREDA